MFLASPQRGQGRGGGKLRSEPELGLGFRSALGSPSGSALAPLEASTGRGGSAFFMAKRASGTRL